MSRYYDPVTHRFINADGYFQSGGDLLDTNMSAYCGNNPVNYSDPTGQYKVCPIDGDSYSQPNCVYCHPEYKSVLDRQVKYQAERDRRKQKREGDKGTSQAFSATSKANTYIYGSVMTASSIAGTTAKASAAITGAVSIVSTPLNIAAHCTNPYLTTDQKIGMSALELGIGVGGVVLSFAIANFWNPSGWVAAGLGLLYTVTTAIGTNLLVGHLENENKKKYGW